MFSFLLENSESLDKKKKSVVQAVKRFKAKPTEVNWWQGFIIEISYEEVISLLKTRISTST